MTGCPECGGKLVFDIESQQIKCTGCSGLFDVSLIASRDRSLEKAKRAAGFTGTDIPNPEELISLKDRGIEVMIHTCSACGAQMIGDGDEPMKECAFCGSREAFSQRTERVFRPEKLIPFRITKEDCITRYRELARRNIFLPSDLKKQSREDFRRVYIPYRVYDFKRDAEYHFVGSVTNRCADADIITDYSVFGRMKSNFPGIAVPGVKGMESTVGKQVAPFAENRAVPFEECYLYGSYAEMADAPPEDTLQKAGRKETEFVMDEAEASFRDIGLNRERSRVSLMEREEEREVTERVNMYPVWIMSHKIGDRVNYAMVNGQTGKVTADQPASLKKTALFSAILAVPLFFLLYSFLTATPDFLLLFTMFAAILMSCFYVEDLRDIYQRKTNVRLPGGRFHIAGGGSAALAFCGLILMLMFEPDSAFGLPVLYGILCCVVMGIGLYESHTVCRALDDVTNQAAQIILLAVSASATVLYLLYDSAAEKLFTALAVLLIAGLIFAALLLVDIHNVLDSVKPKQYLRKGEGEENG